MHYEELQLVDTSFKAHEQLQIFKNQIANRFMNNTYYSPWKTSQKYIEEHSTRT